MMANKKKATKAEKPAKQVKEAAQAWEKGLSVKCAKDESK